MTFFIPLLFICINNNCEFMQSTQMYRSENRCQEDIESQKQRMKGLVKKAGKGKIEKLEGTCVEVKLEYSV